MIKLYLYTLYAHTENWKMLVSRSKPFIEILNFFYTFFHPITPLLVVLENSLLRLFRFHSNCFDRDSMEDHSGVGIPFSNTT